MSSSNATTTESVSRATPPLSRTNLILALILIAQIVITAYLYWPTQAPTTSGAPLLGDITPEDVTALTITDNNERAVSFVKEGDTWTLADTDGYPARPQKITDTLDKLTSIATERLVTQTDGSHDRLQVADNNYLRKVDVTTTSGTETLYFGSSTGASATHVRLANADATYLTSEVATWELDTLATTWIDVTYFRVPKEQITEITLENANGSYTFVPDASGEASQWTLADATADESIASANISTMVDRIATINLHSVLGTSPAPEYGLDSPLATITVVASSNATATTTSDLQTTTLVVGAKDEENNTYYFKSSASEFYVRLAAFTGDEFVTKQRADFMVQASDTGDEATAPAVEPSSVVTSTDAVTETGPITEPVPVSDTVTPTSTISVTATTTVSATDDLTDTSTVTATVGATDTIDSDTDSDAELDATITPTSTVAADE